MLQLSYEDLTAAEKIELMPVVTSGLLYQLIDLEIDVVKANLCCLTVNPNLPLEYAIAQQRLISLQDLKEFFKRVKQEIMPQQTTE